jgi:hypothetical protein
MPKFSLKVGLVFDTVCIEPDDVLSVIFNERNECAQICTKPDHELTFLSIAEDSGEVEEAHTYEPTDNYVLVKETLSDVKARLGFK